jgi:hypothetical protein
MANYHSCPQVPDGLVEVARSKIDGDFDVAAARLDIEQIPYFSVMTTVMTTYVPYEAPHVHRILVPPAAVERAKEIIALAQSGAFELREDEDPPRN